MDSLSELVRLLAPTGTVDLHCRIAGAWSAHKEQAAPGHIPYHVIFDGHARVSTGTNEFVMEAGDVLLFPHGSAHTLSGVQHASTRTAESRHFNGVVTEVLVPGAEAPLEILCGTFVLGSSASVLLRGLPELLCVKTRSERHHFAIEWLRGLIGMMHAEAGTPRQGSAAIIADLSTALFTVLLRTLIEQGSVSQGIMAVISDTRMVSAVDAVIRNPEKPWTIDALAKVCSVSRATLARRFSQLGMTPLELVTVIRMERAAGLLRRGVMSAATVAEQCGYASQAAFGRVFTQHFGVGPGAFRRHHRVLHHHGLRT